MTVPAELDRRFRESAVAEGLVDVGYDLADSPIGLLLVAATDQGVCRVAFDPEPERELATLARAFGTRVLRTPKPVEVVRRQLHEYFEGRRRAFELDLDLRATPAFQQLVLHELARVRYGEVDTYGGLAAKIGKPRAARAVGGALNRNPVPIVLPCHRIVGASGSLVGYGGGLERKRALLELEGAAI
ncbi:MAG: methylated-DNA--[protein]-cysteine S-methyltransferase [Actinobacteria bacterium]|nr:methylated-DNA--[protein]-cysteine S-methyltransferase [Actinomycetota bacterium]